MPTEEQIKQLAHTFWEQEGRPAGRDVQHYLAAKETLEQQEAAQRRPKVPRSPKPRTRSPRAKKQ